MRRGYRWMFRLTGLPGWIRFGFSPGWGGLPPIAQYLSQTGQLPQAISWFRQQTSAPASPSTWSTQQTTPAQLSRDQEIRMLEAQAATLDDQLKQIRERINQLRGQE